MTDLSADNLEILRRKAVASLAAVADATALEAWRVQYLGRSGVLPLALRHIKDLPANQRQAAGLLGNQARQQLEQAYQEKRASLLPQLTVADGRVASGSGAVGHLHPLTQTLRRVQAIFSEMGFHIVEGPNVEEAVNNFDKLNISFEHPARAETDTYYLQDHPDLVLRTHVSPLQIRGVLEQRLTPPFRMMYAGPSYRAEKEDATHGALFQQYEFMVVDTAVSLADLKAVVTHFYSEFFGRETNIRFRPSYFPFVEPGLEVDMQDTVTKKGGWLEMAGAGMVHPNVLRAINVDPTEYQGIALGGGLDRLAMLKYDIPDIRLLYGSDLHFLRQF